MLMHATDVAPINTLGTIGLSQLATIFPVSTVKDILERLERYTCRLRELPNEMMFYFPLMMAFERDDSATETLRRLLEGHENVFQRRTANTTGKAGISKARIRVGSEPLKVAFDSLCKPIAKEATAHTHFDDLLLVAVDAVLVNVPDTKQNAEFGRSTNQHSTHASYPQARIVGLIECGTHAIFAAQIGTYHDGELKLAKDVLMSVTKDMVLMADRLYLGWKLVKQVHDTGAKIVWRFKAKEKDRFEILEQLPDGSYSALYHVPEDVVKHSPKGTVHEPLPVRVCSYRVQGENSEDVHLITTMLDYTKAPVIKLAELYRQRWEIELVYKEMKVELNKNETAIRSGTPELVRQELFGLMMAHYSIRSLMYEAAARAKIDPDIISFRDTVRAIRRKSLKGDSFSP